MLLHKASGKVIPHTDIANCFPAHFRQDLRLTSNTFSLLYEAIWPETDEPPSRFFLRTLQAK